VNCQERWQVLQRDFRHCRLSICKLLYPKFAEFLQLTDDVMAALTLVEHQLATGDKSKVVRDNTRRFLWPPYGIGQAIIFSSCRLFCLLLSSFFVFLA